MTSTGITFSVTFVPLDGSYKGQAKVLPDRLTTTIKPNHLYIKDLLILGSSYIGSHLVIHLMYYFMEESTYLCQYFRIIHCLISGNFMLVNPNLSYHLSYTVLTYLIKKKRQLFCILSFHFVPTICSARVGII